MESVERFAQRIVENDVLVNVGQLVTSALAHEWQGDYGSYEDLLDLSYKLDFCGAASDHVRELAEDDPEGLLDWAVDNDITYSEELHRGTIGQIEDRLAGDLDRAVDFVNEFSVVMDEYEVETLEYWAVTDWLAEHLEALGEPVVYDWCGLTIWGRQTSGQAISIDSVMLYLATNLKTMFGE